MDIDLQYDCETGIYRARHDFESGRSLSTTVVLVLEEALDDDAATQVLHDAVDPDALDALFRSQASASSQNPDRVVFVVEDHEITVYGDGTIVVRPPTE